MQRMCVLDTETTGTSPKQGDRIIEVGVVEMIDRKLTGRTLQFYLNADGKESHPDALAVHGLTPEFLADKPSFKAIAEELIRFCQGATVVIHNADFDLGFLDAELARIKKPSFLSCVQGTSLDTMSLAKALLPGKRKSLDALCNHYGIDLSSRIFHGALLDSQLLAEVYIAMTRSQESLDINTQDDSFCLPQCLGVSASSDIAAAKSQFAVSPETQAVHEQYLAAMASKGKSIWLDILQKQLNR